MYSIIYLYKSKEKYLFLDLKFNFLDKLVFKIFIFLNNYRIVKLKSFERLEFYE